MEGFSFIEAVFQEGTLSGTPKIRACEIIDELELERLPDCLEIIAETKKHEIMALQHKEYKVYGVQFHPESIMTPEGRTILKNFLSL